MIIGGLGLCAMEFNGIIFVNFDEFTSPPPRLWISNIFSKTRDFYIIINAREGGGSGIFLYYLVVMLGANIAAPSVRLAKQGAHHVTPSRATFPAGEGFFSYSLHSG